MKYVSTVFDIFLLLVDDNFQILIYNIDLDLFLQLFLFVLLLDSLRAQVILPPLLPLQLSHFVPVLACHSIVRS